MKNAVDGTTWNDSLSSAIRAYKLGDLDLAEQRLDKAFASGGTKIPYLHLLAGHIAHSRGALAEAEKSWRRVHEIDPDNGEAWNNLGVLYRRRGEDEKALAAFEEAAAKAPKRPDIPYNIGNLHKTAKRYDEAIAAYNRAIEVDPEYAPAYNNLGTLYEACHEREKALKVFKRGLSADKGDASIRFNMGLVFQEEKRWDDARDAFDRALKSRPGWIPGLNNLGIVLQEMGREDEAARTFRSLLDIEPENVSALNNLGVTYDRLGRAEDARNCYRKALEEEPAYINAALNLHDSFQNSQELNEALEEINKQITHHPRNPEIRVRMGRTLMGLTRWDEAERSLDHILERNPEHREALRAKADLFLATKRPVEAEAILKQLPHDPEVVRDLARLNIATERPETAERLLGELIAVNPDDAESRRLMADLLNESRPEEALRMMEEAGEAEPGETGDLVSLAELYGRTGSRDKALGKLDEAISLLGTRGEAEDLDSLNEVLSLYEKAAEALGDEKGTLFDERTAQLGRKLQSAMGRSGIGSRRSGQTSALEIPLEKEDALSLLDLNAMEPVIRINEEEETVYLDESAEDLDDAYTELSRHEALRDEAGRFPGGTGAPAGSGAGSGAGAGSGGSGAAAEGASSGPPVHIHLPAQSAIPQPPQVIYQDIRPMTQAPVTQAPPPRNEAPELVVEEITEEEIPVMEEDLFDEELVDEELLEEEPTEEVEDEEEDDEPFFIPESDALSEDLPENAEPVLPDADLIFPDKEETVEDLLVLEEEDDEVFLTEDFDIPEPETADESDVEELEETEEPNEVEEPDKVEEPEAPAEPTVRTDPMAEMFKYLSDLTDKTTGEGRQHLIEEGVPLKLAGIYARLIGEPKLREVAQKYDRRQRERHNIELDEEKIRGSLNAFKELAKSFPNLSVAESLSQKLGKIMSFVGRTNSPPDPAETDLTAEELPPSEIPESNGNAEKDVKKRNESIDPIAAHEDFAAVLPDMDED